MSLDAQINFGNVVAGSTAKPAAVNGDHIYARWVGYIVPTVSGVYTLGVNSDDGANLFIGDTPILQSLSASPVANSTTTYNASGQIELTAGVHYPVTLEWQQTSGTYQIQLLWTPPGGSVQLIPSANLSTSQSTVTGNLAGSWWNGTRGVWFPNGPGVVYEADGRTPGTTGRNLCYNGDFSIYTPPTGVQSSLASSVRADDLDNSGAVKNATPNGWTRNFDNASNGEGVFYRSDLSGFGFNQAGGFGVVAQDRNGSVGDAFAVVSDAIPLTPGLTYRFSSNVFPGLGVALPAHAVWYFRVYFYKQNATDFSRTGNLSTATPTGTGEGSGTGAGIWDIVAASTSVTQAVHAANLKVPSDSGFARIAFYHHFDGTAPASVWNLCFGDVRCIPVTVDGEAKFNASTHLNGQGSIVPSQPIQEPSFTTTSTSIAFGSYTQSVELSDGSTISISFSAFTYSSLTANTTYHFYMYVRLSDLTVQFANSNPPPTSPSGSFAVQCALDGRVPIAPFTVATPSSGGTSGGGGTTCPEGNELVEVQGRGVIAAKDVNLFDLIKGRNMKDGSDIFRRVISLRSAPCLAWWLVQGYKVSPCEPVWVNEKWTPAFKAPGAVFNGDPGVKIELHVEAGENDEHNFYLVGDSPLLIHNENLTS